MSIQIILWLCFIAAAFILALPAGAEDGKNSRSDRLPVIVLKFSQQKFWRRTPSPFPDVEARLLWEAQWKKGYECSFTLESAKLSTNERRRLILLLKSAGFNLSVPRRRRLPSGAVEVAAPPPPFVLMCFSTDLPADACKYQIEVQVNEYFLSQTASFDDGCNEQSIQKLLEYCKQKCHSNELGTLK